MKRIISLFIVLIMLLSFVSSCSLLPEELKRCEVKFYVDGILYDTKSVTLGKTVSAPDAPKRENEIFVGWSVTGTTSDSFDFSKKITTDLSLSANYVIDAVSLTNMITKQTIKSIVTVRNKCYNTVGGTAVESNSAISQGSGVIVDISGGYCYVLTNNHVVELEKGFGKQSFTVEDPWGNIYEAQIYKNSYKLGYAMSDEYDLALLYFKYEPDDKHSLEEIIMAQNPKEGDYIVAVGTPGGLQNAITYGEVIAYQQIKADEGSSMNNIKFETILHNAPLEHGSSGSALLNTKGQLVGINFAGYSDGIYGCAIPMDKILEFMNLYVY